MFDVIIIGGGPAGLTAALYTSRRMLKTLILSRDLGGQAAKTFEIENYPGIDHISGMELSSRMLNQAKSFGAEIKFEETTKVTPENNAFTVITSLGEYHSKTVIFAFGKQPKDLKVKGEEEYKGRGVSYCATCDAPFFKDKVTVVAGSGNSAADAALLLSKICSQVYIINQRSLTANQELVEQIESSNNINVVSDDSIKEITGDQKKVESVILASGKEIKTDGVFVEIGYVVDRTLAEGLIEISDDNQIITNEMQETKVPGLFAAGDLTTTKYKQIVIAAGEGAKAALSCYDYIQNIEGKKGIRGDWQKLLKKEEK